MLDVLGGVADRRAVALRGHVETGAGAEREALVPRATGGIPMSRHGVAAPRMSLVAPQQPVFQASRKRSESPPRGHFQVVNKQYLPMGSAASACTSRCPSGGIQLTMDSLKMGGGVVGGRCKVHPR